MKNLTINEEQMTFVLKEFLKQYTGQFDHATFDATIEGYLVHFHQSPEPPPMRDEEESYHSKVAEPAPSYMPPITVFGGFGGGSSGGGGASGTW